MWSLLLPPLIFCILFPWGLLGCSMDFVTLHYQFSDIEFYEPNATLQEAHIKMLACFFNIKCDCPAASISLTVYTCCSCARTFFLIWTKTWRSILGRWRPAACRKPNLDWHFTDCVYAVLHACFLLPIFCRNKSLRGWEKAWRMTSPYILNWANPSLILFAEIDFPPCVLVSIGKGWNVAIKY